MTPRLRAKKYSPEEVLSELEERRRGDVDSDDGDEEPQEPEYYPEQSSDSESDSDDPADRKAPELPQPAPTTSGTQEIAKDGTVWSHLTPGSTADRPPGEHLFTDKPGPTNHAKARIHDHQSSLLCLLDMDMLQHIRDCTVKMARSEEHEDWDLSVSELKAFIAILFFRSIAHQDLQYAKLWTYAAPGIASETMSWDRFRSIMRYLHFDDKETRAARKSQDKFAAMTDVWNSFMENCRKCFIPGANISVGEQLLPTQTQCGFTQYMANEADKFGIKFLMAADVDTNYLLSGFPDLGNNLNSR